MNELAESRLQRLAVASRLGRGTGDAVNLKYHYGRFVCEDGHTNIRKRKFCAGNFCNALVKRIPGRCRLCEEPLTGKRKSWCSEECSTSYYIVTSSSVLRYHVYNRDHGVCATCNMPCVDLEIQIYGYDTMLKLPTPQSAVKRSHHMVMAMRAEMQKRGFSVASNRSFWDADHYEALEEGGSWRLENVQTLCVPCHKKKTAEHTGRRARIKRVVGKKHAATKRARLLAGVSK